MEVVVEYLNGKVLAGHILAFNPKQPVFHLQTTEQGKTASVAVKTTDIKDILFLKRQDGEGPTLRFETIDQSVYAGTISYRLVVEFKDGSVIHGTAIRYEPKEPGFYVIPLSPADRSERIFVNAKAAKKVEHWKLLGRILVEQNKITDQQLEHGISVQRHLREKKIGAILREQNFLTDEQLRQGVEKQAGKGKKLGLILIEAGYITEEQLETALEIQRSNRRKKLGMILVELKILTPNDICIAVATQYRLPWIDLATTDILSRVACLLPAEVERALQVVPVEVRENKTLVVATAAPQQPGLKGEIAKHTALKVELVVAFDSYIEAAIDALKDGP